MSEYQSGSVLTPFHTTLDNIVKERFFEPFKPSGEQRTRDKVRQSSGNQSPRIKTSDAYIRESDHNTLTMGLIGCLPDNVQQAIKSFSIKAGKQHITFAFPFMEDTIRNFCENHQMTDLGGNPEKPQYISSGLFFDECFEVIQGFQTYVTFVPHVNHNSLPIVLLTLSQRDSTEGIRRHFQSLVRILLEKPSLPGLWKLPTMVAELTPKYRNIVIDTCSETTVELQAESLVHTFPGKSHDQLLSLVKEKLLSPHFLSYKEMFRRNVQQVIRHLNNTDPSYFLSVIELLQSTGCSHLDFKKVDLMFRSPAIDVVIKEFWQIWGQEQIARRVFPVTMTSAKLGPIGTIGGNTESLISMGPLSHVPVKEGLQSIIKCLKSQDISHTRTKRDENQLHSCNCNICRIHPASAHTSRFRLYGDITRKLNNIPAECSAFHLPLQNKTPSVDHRDNYAARTLRLSSTSPLYSEARIRDFRSIKTSKDISHNTQSLPADIGSRATYAHHHRSLLQPVPHYFPLNLKAFAQPLMYSYSVLNKPHYTLTLNTPQQL